MAKSFLLVSLDLESTGLSVYTEEVTQLGASYERVVIDVSGQVVSRQRLLHFVALVDPKREKLNPIVVRLTGLSRDMLRGQPRVGVVLQQFVAHTEQLRTPVDTVILLAYNGNAFDVPLLVAESMRGVGLTETLALLAGLNVSYSVDMLPFARCHMTTANLDRTPTGRLSYKLGSVYQAACGVPLANAHDALVDCNAVLDILSSAQSVATAFWAEFVAPVSRNSRHRRDFMTLVCDCATKIETHLAKDGPRNRIDFTPRQYRPEAKQQPLRPVAVSTAPLVHTPLAVQDTPPIPQMDNIQTTTQGGGTLCSADEMHVEPTQTLVLPHSQVLSDCNATTTPMLSPHAYLIQEHTLPVIYMHLQQCGKLMARLVTVSGPDSVVREHDLGLVPSCSNDLQSYAYTSRRKLYKQQCVAIVHRYRTFVRTWYHSVSQPAAPVMLVTALCPDRDCTEFVLRQFFDEVVDGPVVLYPGRMSDADYYDGARQVALPQACLSIFQPMPVLSIVLCPDTHLPHIQLVVYNARGVPQGPMWKGRPRTCPLDSTSVEYSMKYGNYRNKCHKVVGWFRYMVDIWYQTPLVDTLYPGRDHAEFILRQFLDTLIEGPVVEYPGRMSDAQFYQGLTPRLA
jgi:DNA polymerase III epsilon subunit-like protein